MLILRDQHQPHVADKLGLFFLVKIKLIFLFLKLGGYYESFAMFMPDEKV